MSSIATNPLASASNAATAAAGSSAANSASSSALGTGTVDETTFLQLLVAQLKNQDPENPQDGTQFVSQLAQFTSLEQELGMKTDLDGILTQLKGPVAPPATPAVTGTQPATGASATTGASTSTTGS